MKSIALSESYWSWRAKPLAAWLAMILIAQLCAFGIISSLLSPNIVIYYNYGLNNSMLAGDFKNILGIGNFINSDNKGDVEKLLTVMTYYIVCRLFPTYFYFHPTYLFAGMLSNKIEMLLLGRVFDFIVIPKGGDAIAALSIGDVFIYAGFAALFINVTILRYRHLNSLKQQLKSWNMKLNKYDRNVLIQLARARRLKTEKAAAQGKTATRTA